MLRRAALPGAPRPRLKLSPRVEVKVQPQYQMIFFKMYKIVVKILRLEFSLIAYLTRAAENDTAAKQSGSLHILLFEFRMGNALSAVEESF